MLVETQVEEGKIGRDLSVGMKESGGEERIGQVLHLGRLHGAGGTWAYGRDLRSGRVVLKILLKLGGLLYVIRGHLGKSFEVELWSARIGKRSCITRCKECAPGK